MCTCISVFVYVCTCISSEIYEALIVIWYTESERWRVERCGRKCYWPGLRNYSNSALKVLKKIMQELILVARPQLGFETVTSWMWMRHVTLLTCLFCLVYSKCHNVRDLTMYPLGNRQCCIATMYPAQMSLILLNGALIRSVVLPFGIAMLCYMLDVQLFLLPQLINHRQFIQ